MNPLTLVIFGATGNLYADKLAKALYLLFLETALPPDFQIIAFARRDLSDQDFRTSTKESILKRGDIDTSRLDAFLEHIIYFKGNFLEKSDFARLKDFIAQSFSTDQDGQLLLHIATASALYEKIFENIEAYGIHTIQKSTRILIEKPFGKNEADAIHLESVLSKIFTPESIFHIDHYLAKETVRNVFDFNSDKNNIEKIKVIFHESNTVGARGAYYDAVGAFRDVGQNHMLQLLALAIMDKSRISNTKDTRASRLKALNDIYVDYDQKLTRAQYEGYKKESGVIPYSETETFFRVFLRSKNPDVSNILFELEGGKGLIDMHSEIAPTTVAVEIYFTTGEKQELKIQPVPGTVYESYAKVYTDAIKGDQTNFPSIEEIIAEWKIADELLEKWKRAPLVIYKKGTRAEDIK